jgi:hypothetical protein
MNGLTHWQITHSVSNTAMVELRRLLAAPITSALHEPDVALSEAAVQNNVRLAASRRGIVNFRNNSGAGKIEGENRFIRWGLCNDSKNLNAQYKSSDVIGIKPVVIHQAHVGLTLGIFWARECKPSNWKRPSNEREFAQQRFIELINAHGGDARFATNTDDL